MTGRSGRTRPAPDRQARARAWRWSVSRSLAAASPANEQAARAAAEPPMPGSSPDGQA
jgi:hypothetical protein